MKGFVVVVSLYRAVALSRKGGGKSRNPRQSYMARPERAADETSSFSSQRSFCCQASSPWSWETPGPSVQPFRDLLFNSGALFCGISSQSYLFAGTSAWRSARTKVSLLKREAKPCQEWGWAGRETDEEDAFFTHLVCTLPVSSLLSSGHVSEPWHPEELECTSYFQYCSPQGSRNHKPSSSKLQDWVKSHETAVKITFQGSFSLSSETYVLRPARFRISLQQKKVKTCIIFSVKWETVLWQGELKLYRKYYFCKVRSGGWRPSFCSAWGMRWL